MGNLWQSGMVFLQLMEGSGADCRVSIIPDSSRITCRDRVKLAGTSDSSLHILEMGCTVCRNLSGMFNPGQHSRLSRVAGV
jgi:hypothetical protein